MKIFKQQTNFSKNTRSSFVKIAKNFGVKRESNVANLKLMDMCFLSNKNQKRPHAAFKCKNGLIHRRVRKKEGVFLKSQKYICTLKY